MPRSSRRALAVLLAVAGAATTYVLPGRPADAAADATPDTTTWVTNGTVEAVLNVGDRTYLGGSFDQVGPNTGFGVPIEGASVAATFSKVNGPVYVAVPDGDNGWYIGGDFTRVGSKSRHNVAQILDDGTVGGWNPNADRPVRSIAVDNPNKRIYIGGEFTQIRSNTQLPDGTYEMVAAGGLAATKKSGGAIDTALPLPAMAPNPSTAPGALRYSVNALALSSDKAALFVGGSFTTFGGAARPGLAKVNLNGTPALDAGWNPQPNGAVAALVGDAARLVVGGSFTAMGTASRTGLAVVGTSGTGEVDPHFAITANGPVYALARGNGAPGAAGIFVGGAFTQLGNQARNRLGLIGTHLQGGYLDGFHPTGVGADGDVLSLAMHPTSPGLYVGGAFKSLGGASHRHYAVVNTEFGIVSPAEPMIAGPVRAVAASATQVFAGGDFTAVGGEIRRNVAALRADGSLDTGFRADTDGPVYALAADASSLYIGGVYKNIAQYTQREHRGLTKVARATGAVDDAFKANIDASVYTLALSGPRLFIGGNFSAVSNRGAAGSVDIPRAGGASVNTTTGAVEAWNPSPDAAIHHLVLSPDHSKVYIGGDFKKVGITPKTRMAAVDTGNGVPTPWTPTVPGQVIKMTVSPDGNKIYVAVGGGSVNGNRLQAWNTVTSTLLWEALGDGDFQAVALSSSLLYAGGHFDVVNKTAVRQHLATFDPHTGALQPWGPPIGGIKGVLDLQVTAGHIYVAGEFDKIGSTVAQGIARFANAGDPPPTTTTTLPGSTPTTLPSDPPTTPPTAGGSPGGGSPGGGSPGGGSPGGGDPGPGLGAAGASAGYWMVGSEGSVYSFGDAGHFGGAFPAAGSSVVDLEPTPSGKGYWLVTDKGVVTTHGDAVSFGAPAPASLPRGEAVTSLSGTPSGRGYWLFTNKGRVLNFGDATHFGDMAKTTLNAPVLDSIPTTTGRGYYMVAADGGIFSFGDAKFYGSMGGKPLNAPVVSLVPDGDGVGYWLVASDGGIFAFQAGFKGSMGGKPLNKPVTGMVRFADGYLMVGEDGGIFNFSSRAFLGSLGGNPPARPIVSVAALG